MRLYRHVYTDDLAIDDDANGFRAVARLDWVGIVIVKPKSLDAGGTFETNLLSTGSRNTTIKHEQRPR